jgi:hypothetical protein
MKTYLKAFFSLALISGAAIAGDEVSNGRVVKPENLAPKEEQFCMQDPVSKEEVCVEKSKKAELEKKMKEKAKPAVKKPPVE